ncbi:ABC transporter permease [Saonia flava]|nr:FtsX-like permease family protein [Saonia flava]
MAWRDGKASGKRLVLFMASIILGIAAVVSIQSFSNNLKENITIQSKALMGADFVIDSEQLPNEKVQRIIDSLGGQNAREVNFVSMVAFPNSGATKFMQVRGIEGGYPFYGTLMTKPISAGKKYQRNNGALVDGTVLLQYNVKVGDSIKIGNSVFPILGTLLSVPGSTGIGASFAPSVLIPFHSVEGTGLLQKGSRIDYNYYFVAKPEQDLELLNETVDPILDAERADMDTHTETSERLGRRYENVGRFLNLVAFIALLLGCVGVASSVHIYIKEKLRAVAVLKCIGATRKQTFLIYLIQIAGMGLLGGLIGTVAGLVLQQLFPLILQGLLPFQVELSISFQAILMGLTLGLFMSVLFALSPLLSTWYVSPLQVLRIDEQGSFASKKARLWVLAAIVLFTFLFAFWLLQNWQRAFVFVVGILITFAVLAGFANLFMKGIKKYFPSSWGFTARQSLLNLFRPNNQTTVLVLAIGVGMFLISTLYFTKDFLLAKANLENNEQSPNIILFDIQTEQKEAVVNSILLDELPVISTIPIVTMRVHSIKGKLANAIRLDTTSTINQWIINHEFRITYRDSLISSENSVEGEWPSVAIAGEPIPISLSDNVARDAQVKLGDHMVFNVQGVIMETVVRHIRTVDWGRVQLNFSILFPKGVLEKAPQFHVVTTHAPDEATSATMQRELVHKFPNVSILDLRQILSLIEDILNKISWVINFMAFFSILTGIMVLIGSVRTSKYQRIKESVLLRTIGARSKQILRITALEYLYLGLLGSGIGLLLAVLGSQMLAYFVFEIPFTPSWVPFLVILPGITFLVLLIGLGNSISVLRSPPLEVLRKEKS